MSVDHALHVQLDIHRRTYGFDSLQVIKQHVG